MKTATFPNAEKLAHLENKVPPIERQFPALESVTRPAVDTASCAYYLCRQEQTLRAWACLGTGPIRPIRVCGRLAWPVSEIRRLLGVA